jgi:segregation and condensation protein A
MSGYRVQTEIFQGPMDLLLFLVRRQEVPVAEIRISEITGQYLEHLDLMRKMDLEPAAEFAVMAATLMEIKSETLLPVDPAPGGDGADKPADARAELVRQLLAYKAYKDAADRLEASGEVFNRRFGRPAMRIADSAAAPADGDDGEPVEELEVWDLLKAFAKLLEDTGSAGPAVHKIDYDDTPIEVHAERVAKRLEAEGPLTLLQLIEGKTSRSEIIGVFLSLLELAKQRMIIIEQAELFAAIRVRLRPIGERGHAAHEAMLAARAAAEQAAAGQAAARQALGGGDTDDDEAGPDGEDAPAAESRFLSDDVDPDLLDDEINSIDIPDVDLGRGRSRPDG